MEILKEIWLFVDSIGWILVIIVIVLCFYLLYRVYKAGINRDPRQENTYYAATKKRNMYECLYDPKGRSCTYYNNATGIKKVDCKDCSWYNNGVRPSRF